jgi:hypothetical protein
MKDQHPCKSRSTQQLALSASLVIASSVAFGANHSNTVKSIDKIDGPTTAALKKAKSILFNGQRPSTGKDSHKPIITTQWGNWQNY